MGRTISTDEPGTIDGEPDRQPLDRDVVDNLVVAALQERGIDRGERLHALGGKARSERHSVLLGYADVEGTVGKALPEDVEPGAIRHRGRDRNDALVLLRLRDEAVGKHARIGRRIGLGLHLRPGDDIELADAMVLVQGRLGGRVALALLGHHVDENRPLLGVPHVLQDRKQVIEVVAVDGTDVIETQLLEPHAPLPKVAGVLLEAGGASLPALRQALGELFGDVAPVEIGAARRDPGEV